MITERGIKFGDKETAGNLGGIGAQKRARIIHHVSTAHAHGWSRRRARGLQLIWALAAANAGKTQSALPSYSRA